MKCNRCGHVIDPKFKECPYCSEPVTWKESHEEMKSRRREAKGREKEVYIDADIAEFRKNEDLPAHFGRGTRNRDLIYHDYIPIIAVVGLILIVFLSAGIISSGRNDKVKRDTVIYASETNAISTMTDAAMNDEIDKNKSNDEDKTESVSDVRDQNNEMLTEASTMTDASKNDDEVTVDPRNIDLYQGKVLESIILDILENGEQSYIDYLNENRNKVVTVSEDMLSDDPSGAYDCIWRGLGSVALVPEYKDNGATSYSFMIDDNGTVHVYIATEDNPASYELYPETDPVYKTE